MLSERKRGEGGTKRARQRHTHAHTHTHTHTQHTNALLSFLSRVEGSVFDCLWNEQGSFDLILQRLGRRQGHFMPSVLLQSQFDVLEPPDPKEELCISVNITQSPRTFCFSFAGHVLYKLGQMVCVSTCLCVSLCVSLCNPDGLHAAAAAAAAEHLFLLLSMAVDCR